MESILLPSVIYISISKRKNYLDTQRKYDLSEAFNAASSLFYLAQQILLPSPNIVITTSCGKNFTTLYIHF
jgi:hypothetical protein